jgi:cyanophycinase
VRIAFSRGRPLAEHGHIGRRLGAVAHDPRVRGIGLDEDTAIALESERIAAVGSGAVYAVDGGGAAADPCRLDVAASRRRWALMVADRRGGLVLRRESRRPAGVHDNAPSART